MEELIQLDESLFFLINRYHTPFIDQVMAGVTKTVFWTPLYAIMIYFIIAHYRKRAWIFLVAITLTILLSDQVTSGFMKPYFQRMRPSHEPGLAGLVHTVNGYKGSTYGFASSHAANTFGVATLLFLALRNLQRYIHLIFLWPVIVVYSRIYLGVHYPGDVLVGGLVGVFFALVFFRISTAATVALAKRRNGNG